MVAPSALGRDAGVNIVWGRRKREGKDPPCVAAAGISFRAFGSDFSTLDKYILTAKPSPPSRNGLGRMPAPSGGRLVPFPPDWTGWWGGTTGHGRATECSTVNLHSAAMASLIVHILSPVQGQAITVQQRNT